LLVRSRRFCQDPRALSLNRKIAAQGATNKIGINSAEPTFICFPFCN
jgi:hypothetical protein